MDCSTPGLPVHHQYPELTQTHVHWVSDAIQPSHPLSSPSPPTFNLFQHQGLFQWVSSSHQVAKELGFQLQHQSFQWICRTRFLYSGLVGIPHQDTPMRFSFLNTWETSDCKRPGTSGSGGVKKTKTMGAIWTQSSGRPSLSVLRARLPSLLTRSSSGAEGTGRALSSDSIWDLPSLFSLQPEALSFRNKGKQVQKLPGRGFLFWVKRKDLLKPILGASPARLTTHRAVPQEPGSLAGKEPPIWSECLLLRMNVQSRGTRHLRKGSQMKASKRTQPK